MIRTVHNRRTGDVATVSVNDFVQINVSGMNYSVRRKTLNRFPTTLLGNESRRHHYFVDFLDAYFFDRNRQVFEAILYFYQTAGTLIRPTDIPMDVFEQEVRFYGIPEEVLLTLQRKEGYLCYAVALDEQKSPDNYWQRKIWKTLEYPDSCILARLISFWSTFIILVSIATLCLETLPQYRRSKRESTRIVKYNVSAPENNDTIGGDGVQPATMYEYVTAAHSFSFHRTVEIVDVVVIVWFVIEYVVRFLVAPRKWKFFKCLLNFIDLCAILPYFLLLSITSPDDASLSLICAARVVRVFRVFKLSRHSPGLQVLGSTLKASINEVVMVVCMVAYSIVIFSTAIYYAEFTTDGEGGTFTSIPDAFWYTLVTMTTVGYGDVVPATLMGKVIGGVCAMNGVVVVAMVVPVFVNNFQFFYKRDRLNRVKREDEEMTYEQVGMVGEALGAVISHSGE